MDRIPLNPYDFFGYLASGFLVVISLEYALGFPALLRRDLTLLESTALLIATYVAGQLIATPSKAILEDFIVGRLLGRPNVNLFRSNPPRLARLLFPGFYITLPEPIRTRILDKAKAEGVPGAGEALFLHVRYSPATLQNSDLMSRLNSFLNQYGFNRNLSFVAVVAGAAMLARWVEPPVADPELRYYGIVALVGGILLFYRYLKFYRQYSYEMFNVYGRAD